MSTLGEINKRAARAYLSPKIFSALMKNNDPVTKIENKRKRELFRYYITPR